MPDERRDLQQVITDMLGDAAVLHRRGQTALAQQLEVCARDVQAAAEEWLTMLTESEAALFSGETVRWLQSRFPALERRGMARRDGKTRLYRMCALPRRAETARAYENGRAAARKAAS